MKSLIALLALLVAITACDAQRAQAIPAGGQVVHVTISAGAVHLEPPTVRPGNVYLVLESPADGHLTFVERQSSADATPGPLTDKDLARLARGDTEGMSISGLDAGGCSPDQNAQDQGRLGPCGNVMLVVVATGAYAVVGGSPEADPVTGRTPPAAVLSVGP